MTAAVIGGDGAPASTNVRYLKLVDDLAGAEDDLRRVRRARRLAEMTGDVDDGILRAERDAEASVGALKKAMDKASQGRSKR